MDFSGVFLQQVFQIPLYAIWAFGIYYAFTNRVRHPRAFRLAGIALVVILVGTIVFSLLSGMLPVLLLSNSTISTAQYGIIALIMGIVQILIQCVVWVLILMALFAGPSSVSSYTPEQ